MQPGFQLPDKLRKLIEAWVEVHEYELLEQWENARRGFPVQIVG